MEHTSTLSQLLYKWSSITHCTPPTKPPLLPATWWGGGGGGEEGFLGSIPSQRSSRPYSLTSDSGTAAGILAGGWLVVMMMRTMMSLRWFGRAHTHTHTSCKLTSPTNQSQWPSPTRSDPGVRMERIFAFFLQFVLPLHAYVCACVCVCGLVECACVCLRLTEGKADLLRA